MNVHLMTIKEFLEQRKAVEDIEPSGLPFVTISREAGAGGHTLADSLMRDLAILEKPVFKGWHIFDRLLCEVVAEDPGLNRSMEALAKQKVRSSWQDFLDGLIPGVQSQHLLHQKTFKIIAMLAAIGKVIIVGRAGSCVTRTIKGGVHVRLVAPEAERVNRIMKRENISREKAEELVKEQDADRRKLIRTFFDKDIESPVNYDVVWNSGTLDVKDMSSGTLRLIKRRAIQGGNEV